MFRRRSKDQTSDRQPARDLPPRTKAFSYYEARSPRETVANRQRSSQSSPAATGSRRSTLGRRQAMGLLVLIIIVICVGYELWLGSQPKIVVVGSNTPSHLFLRPESQYAAAAQKLLSKSAGNRDKLTINTAAIAIHMERMFPELAGVSISVPLLGHQPIVYLEPAKPALVLRSQAHDNYLLLAANGAALAQNTSGWPSLALPTVTDQTARQATVGQIALADSDVDFIQQVAAQLQANHIPIQSFVLPAASRELDVYIGGQPYFVKFNLNDEKDAAQQIGTFLATRQYLASKNITPSQYIDARVLGRVYYK